FGVEHDLFRKLPPDLIDPGRADRADRPRKSVKCQREEFRREPLPYDLRLREQKAIVQDVVRMRLDQDLPFSQIIVIEMAVDADLTIQGQLTEACKLLGEQEDCIRRRLKPRHIEHVSDLLLKPLRKFPELLH